MAGSAEVNSDNNNYNFAVARLLDNGALDTSFSGNGKVHINFNSPDSNSEDRVQGVAIDPQGRIILAGSAQVSAANHDFAVVRLTAAGALDETFDGDGRATVAFNLADVFFLLGNLLLMATLMVEVVRHRDRLVGMHALRRRPRP